MTGAASGFGRAVVAELRRRGDGVRGIDLQPGDGVVGADIRSQDQVRAAVTEIVEELDGLDVLINNAGIGDVASTGAFPDERVAAMLDTNLLGAWRTTAAALPALLASRGRVINIASGLAFVNMPFAAGYAASKRGLCAYSDTLRMEYGDAITVTTVYPGYVKTPIHRASEKFGVSLAGAVPEDSLDAVVRTIVRACHRKRARRDTATGPASAAGIFFARHFPRSTDRVVSRQRARLVRRGRIPSSLPLDDEGNVAVAVRGPG